MKCRMRKGDTVFEAVRHNLGANVKIGDAVACLSHNEFQALFEPVPEPESEEVKLAKTLYNSHQGEVPWSEMTSKYAYLREARAVLAAGYTPPKPEPVIGVGSRVAFASDPPDDKDKFTIGVIYKSEWAILEGKPGDIPLITRLENLTLAPEENRDG